MSVIYDSSGGAQYSSVNQNQGRSALTMRTVPVDSTVNSARIATAGDNTILSSAGTAIYVYGLTVTSVNLAQSTGAGVAGSSGAWIRFQSGTTGATQWGWTYWAISTIAQIVDSIMVDPPNYIFRTTTGALLNCAATSTGAMVSVAAWRE